MDKPLTYETARQASIRKWEIVICAWGKERQMDVDEILYDEFGRRFKYDCGLCTYFGGSINICNLSMRNDHCRRCPLFWKDAHEETISDYRKISCLPCSRNYWKFRYHRDAFNNRWALHWARKMLDEIRNTPTCELRPHPKGEQTDDEQKNE